MPRLCSLVFRCCPLITGDAADNLLDHVQASVGTGRNCVGSGWKRDEPRQHSTADKSQDVPGDAVAVFRRG